MLSGVCLTFSHFLLTQAEFWIYCIVFPVYRVVKEDVRKSFHSIRNRCKCTFIIVAFQDILYKIRLFHKFCTVVFILSRIERKTNMIFVISTKNCIQINTSFQKNSFFQVPRVYKTYKKLYSVSSVIVKK